MKRVAKISLIGREMFQKKAKMSLTVWQTPIGANSDYSKKG
jgi:hypothetical protein